MEAINTFLSHALANITSIAPKIIFGLIVLIIGLWAVAKFKKGLLKLLAKKEVDPTLHQFSASSISILLKILLFLSVANFIGLEISSLLAVLGAASLAIGLALQGSLSNLAGGVLILVLRPFKVGDLVFVQGHLGFVRTIDMFNTTIKTKDNLTVVLPNGPLANSTIVNYSTENLIRMEVVVGISYADDIDKAREIMMSVIQEVPFIAPDPAPVVVVKTLADSAVAMMARVWVSYKNESNVPFVLQENFKKAFDKHGITIPFPQRVVHVSGKDSL